MCCTVPLCITQQVQTGGKCIQRRGEEESAADSLHMHHTLNIIHLNCIWYSETAVQRLEVTIIRHMINCPFQVIIIIRTVDFMIIIHHVIVRSLIGLPLLYKRGP